MEPRSIYVGISNMIWDKRIFDMKVDTVKELKTSILEVGLIQPIVVAPTDKPNTWKLIVGRKRYQAIKELYAEDPDRVVKFCGTPIPMGAIPAVDVRDLAPEFLLKLEVHENVYRMDLTWQDKLTALAQLHKVEEAKFEEAKAKGEIAPTETYTVSATARKLAGITGQNEFSVRNQLSKALIIADHLDNPEVKRAESASAGFNNLKRQLTIAARVAAADLGTSTNHTLIEGDCRHELIAQISNQYDLIFADPPYGIGADTYDNMRPHEYKDDWEYAAAVMNAICGQGYRVAKDNANLLLFCTPERWHDVRDIAVNAGWTAWFRPLIWLKSNEGMRPWGQKGFAYTYECIMWATKGSRRLIQTHVDNFSIYRPSPNEREHAAAKPLELIKKLFELTCLPGDFILDPCVGSGISYKAATLLGMSVTGMENQPATIPIARKNMHWDGKTEEVEQVKPGEDNLDDL